MCRNYTNLATFSIIIALFLCSFSLEAKDRAIKLKKGHIFVVTMTTTDGDIVLQLLNQTPQHRDNFVKLSHSGYYDNVLFHRVIDNFMIQAGDPNTRDRSPKAREKYGDEDGAYTLKAEIDTLSPHYRGALGAAREAQNNPQKASSRSQFYIVQCPVSEKFKTQVESGVKHGRISESRAQEYLKRGGCPHLDGNYTVFGYVLKGMDVVDAIAVKKRDSKDCPEKDIEIIKTKVKQYNKKKFKKLYE